MSQARNNALAQVTDFELRLLKVFRQVVESGGFSVAESVLGISRSAISQHMSDLEQRLGLRLCQRGRAGFALTDEGREVYAACLRLFSALENFRTEVNGLHQSLRGELNIGLTDNLVTIPHMSITHALARLRERGPDVRIQINMESPSQVEQGVLDGRLHVGVIPQVGSLSGLEYRALYSERSQLYCAKSHPLFWTPESEITDQLLQKQDAIAPTFRLPAEIQAQYQRLNCKASASDREGMAFLIITGQYIGYLPDHYAEYWVGLGQMRALVPERNFYEVNLASVTRKGRRAHLVLESFLEELALINQAQVRPTPS